MCIKVLYKKNLEIIYVQIKLIIVHMTYGIVFTKNDGVGAGRAGRRERREENL